MCVCLWDLGSIAPHVYTVLQSLFTLRLESHSLVLKSLHQTRHLWGTHSKVNILGIHFRNVLTVWLSTHVFLCQVGWLHTDASGQAHMPCATLGPQKCLPYSPWGCSALPTHPRHIWIKTCYMLGRILDIFMVNMMGTFLQPSFLSLSRFTLRHSSTCPVCSWAATSSAHSRGIWDTDQQTFDVRPRSTAYHHSDTWRKLEEELTSSVHCICNWGSSL